MSALTFLDAGSFRHRISLQEAVDQDDGLGGVERDWIEIRSLWAHMEPVRADMRERASQTDEVVTHRIYVRFNADVKSDMRLVKGDRVFDIDSMMDPDETGRYLLVLARESGR